MAEQNAITRDCTNFMNFLKEKLGVEKFGEFICSYTFPLEEIEALKKAAVRAHKKPVSLRLYYGCDEDGKNHKLYMSLLDENEEVIVDSGNSEDIFPRPFEPGRGGAVRNTILPTDPVDSVAASTAVATRKCPPGGTSDRLISTLVA